MGSPAGSFSYGSITKTMAIGISNHPAKDRGGLALSLAIATDKCRRSSRLDERRGTRRKAKESGITGGLEAMSTARFARQALASS